HTRFSRDWSSDVCSSDLTSTTNQREPPFPHPNPDDIGGLNVNEDGVTLEDAFEVLESFLQRCISEVQADSTQAMRHGQYGAAREGLAKLESLISLLERTNALEQEFIRFVPQQP